MAAEELLDPELDKVAEESLAVLETIVDGKRIVVLSVKAVSPVLEAIVVAMGISQLSVATEELAIPELGGYTEDCSSDTLRVADKTEGDVLLVIAKEELSSCVALNIAEEISSELDTE